MALQLYDTRSGAVRPFVAGRTVRLYVCGITPYDSTHLGHAFTFVAFDALTRYLEHRGHRVRSVRNVTDVDDDILRKARELGMDYLELGRREVARFDRELDALGVRRPDAMPRATETIPAIRMAVGGLLQRGLAYALPDGRVYFDTAASGRLPELSGLDREQMLAVFAEKGGDPDAPGKRDALDFLLWQPSGDGEPSWETDWGAGRPGWHIECSVMAAEELGSVIDIHGGGNDLVFPHHAAETLQAEGLTGQAPFANYWLHVGMVSLDGVKMSKSLGNLVFVGDLLERFEAGAIRRYLLQHHYRSTWSYDDDALQEAAAGFKRWRDAAGSDARHPDLAMAFFSALDDDFDTPAAIQALDSAAEAGAGGTLRELAGVLGFRLI
ncbi:MAG: class I tRNA ligase family protein [Actinomycetota bacterium]|jgi:L-cysteine:1D-myo-inositol 2-amino-2-deoxy-alpha-D-glucopyranoside ligase|nr:cysteine--tRNA ligase [Euzebyaceae bacterium]MDQ3451797.1 class I tRNA ligase family protein [Actinomycetota bacterium]